MDKYGRGPGVSKKEKVDTADMALLNILDKKILVQSRVDFKVTVKKSDGGRPLLLDGKLLNGDTVSGGGRVGNHIMKLNVQCDLKLKSFPNPPALTHAPPPAPS